MDRSWARWRQLQYGAAAVVVLLGLLIFGYVQFFYTAPTCFDDVQNGDERGVDCGGVCDRICPFDTAAPLVRWAQSFKVTDGQYNAVAYVENRNAVEGTDALSYTFTLYDTNGAVITTRSGVTVLPPDGVYPIFEGGIATGTQIPTRTFIELAPVEVWHAVPIGREQFEVRDRVLLSADSAPRLNAQLYNTSLEEAENVEVVATIFDRQGTALTASRSVVPRFGAREEQTVVFTWPEPIATTVRSCEVPTDVLLAIDLSGSMNNDGGIPPEPVTSALAAAESFVGRLRAADQAGVVTYATDATLARSLSGAHDATAAAVRTFSIAPEEETGTTNIGAAIARATTELQSTRHSDDARKVLVLLTDGRATAPDPDPAAYARTAAQAARDADIEIFTIGLGNTIDTALLSAIASDPAQQFTAATAADLDRIYRSISTALCEEGPAVIDIVPKVLGS